MLLADKCYDATNELAHAVACCIEHSHSIEHLNAAIDAMFVLADTSASMALASGKKVLSVTEVANHNVMMALLHKINEHAVDAEKALNRLEVIARFNERLSGAIECVYGTLQECYEDKKRPFVYDGIEQIYDRLMT
jgi:hypothetical protein